MNIFVSMDIAGCPNRCKHCWLGHEKNKNIKIEDYFWVAEQFRNYKLNSEIDINEINYFSWYREPDYADNYMELWEIDKKLSSDMPPKFELASIWRLARDKEYAPWLNSLGVNKVQITLFGAEELTDYFIGRRGAYKDIFRGIDTLIDNKIVPIIQIFVYKTNITDLINIVPLLRDIEAKLNQIHKQFECFVKTSDPMGAGFGLEKIRVTRDDLEMIPKYIKDKTLSIKGKENYLDLWKTEKELLMDLLTDNLPPNDNPNITGFMISNNFNVYPNNGEIVEYANLGNLKTDGINTIMDNFINNKTLYLKMNHTMPVSYFAKKYGDLKSERITSRYELCKKWMHLEAEGLFCN